MASMKEKALLVALIGDMCKSGSWCGETHVQKTVYFGRELLGMPFGYEFILYKHGPFSFELRDDLVSMQADGFLQQEIQPYPYGPSLTPGGVAKTLSDRFSKTLGEYQARVHFLSTEIANRRAAELERIATALYVMRKHPERSESERAKILTDLKPHVSHDDAVTAVRYVDGLAERVRQLA